MIADLINFIFAALFFTIGVTGVLIYRASPNMDRLLKVVIACVLVVAFLVLLAIMPEAGM